MNPGRCGLEHGIGAMYDPESGQVVDVLAVPEDHGGAQDTDLGDDQDEEGH